jgi:hypothetical protein
MKKPRQIKKIQARSRNLKILPINLNRFVVESRTSAPNNHLVEVQFNPDGEVKATCTCAWSRYNGVACAHVIAALEHLAAYKGRRLAFWLTEDDARRQKHRIFHMRSDDNNPDDGVWITSRAG